MSDPTIAFHRQPLEILAQGGAAVTDQVLHTLSDWVRTDRAAQAAAHAQRSLYVLKSVASALNVVVITHGHRQGHWAVNVCALDDADAGALAMHFEPLLAVDHIMPMMELKFKKLDVLTVLRAAETLDLVAPHHGRLSFKTYARSRWNPGRLLEVIDESSDRWASSKARMNFKTLMDDARERPQVVERDGDDLLVVSRQYLKEAVEPTSAQGLSRRYREMALPDRDMPTLSMGRLPALEPLPEIGPA